MLHGDQRSQVDLSFSIPSLCATRVEEGIIDAGLVPVAEVARQNLEIVADVGIAAIGEVRSILLISRVPFGSIRTLAVDLSSRTSVQLARVILQERYGVEPSLTPAHPDMNVMLSAYDAALIIGDPALRINLEQLTFPYLDLSAEWRLLTGLPMVFATWAGKPGAVPSRFREIARRSYDLGRQNLAEIAETEFIRRGITRDLATDYFAKYIKFELGAAEMRGLEAFFELARLIPSRSISS